MKPFALSLLVVAACSLALPDARAQYKGPRDYFPKSYPAPAPGGGSPRGTNSAPANAPSTKGSQSAFKDLPLSAGFYFLSDTNRTYLWTKISATSAKNSKNGVTQAIGAETPVQK